MSIFSKRYSSSRFAQHVINEIVGKLSSFTARRTKDRADANRVHAREGCAVQFWFDWIWKRCFSETTGSSKVHQVLRNAPICCRDEV